MAVNEPRTQTRLADLVAEELRALLARRRISGRQLARELGESPSWVNFRLTGHTAIGLNDLQRIAEVLQVTPTDLLPSKPSDGHGRVTAAYRPRSPRTPVALITGHGQPHPTGHREPRRPVLLTGPNAG